MLINRPTELLPSPSPGGRERAATHLNADALNIPPYNGLAAWDSWMAQERRRNPRAMVERYAHMAGPEAYDEPPRRSIPSTVAMGMLENGHCYLARHWDLEAVDSMLGRDILLIDGCTPLPPEQPPHPLTTKVFGTAGSWHRGHAVYCLRWWAQRRWQHDRALLATWRFNPDSRQQAEVIPPHNRASPPTTANLCPVLAIHQIQALAAGQVLPAIRTEEEARAAYAALVSKIINPLRTALIWHPGNPAMP